MARRTKRRTFLKQSTVAGAGFVMLPTLGYARTGGLGAIIQSLVGLIAVFALRTISTEPHQRKHGPAIAATPAIAPGTRALAWATLLGTGLALMVYVIAWNRLLTMSLGGTTYCFTCILTACLLALALGSLLIARWVERIGEPLLVWGGLDLTYHF